MIREFYLYLIGYKYVECHGCKKKILMKKNNIFDGIEIYCVNCGLNNDD